MEMFTRHLIEEQRKHGQVRKIWEASEKWQLEMDQSLRGSMFLPITYFGFLASRTEAICCFKPHTHTIIAD